MLYLNPGAGQEHQIREKTCRSLLSVWAVRRGGHFHLPDLVNSTVWNRSTKEMALCLKGKMLECWQTEDWSGVAVMSATT